MFQQGFEFGLGLVTAFSLAYAAGWAVKRGLRVISYVQDLKRRVGEMEDA